jgi:hypothetical protein
MANHCFGIIALPTVMFTVAKRSHLTKVLALVPINEERLLPTSSCHYLNQCLDITVKQCLGIFVKQCLDIIANQYLDMCLDTIANQCIDIIVNQCFDIYCQPVS